MSLIIAIPVFLWAASGFMHPLMTNVRPKMATQFLVPKTVDPTKINVNLEQALEQQQITKFYNFRLVSIDTNWFYQVQTEYNSIPVYLSAKTGKILRNGDRLYAQYIAKLFLEGQGKDVSSKDAAEAKQQAAEQTASAMDCCDAATACVLGNEKGSLVDTVSLVTSFDKEYKYVNRYLPVYKVAFERTDGIRIYVHTMGDKFAYAVDNKRAIFDKIFALFHTWNFLDGVETLNILLKAGLLILSFIAALMGIYIFFITKTKKANGNEVVKARRNHRWTSIIASLFTLMFSFSGAFHALEKLNEDDKYKFHNDQVIQRNAINLNVDSLSSVIKSPIKNISIVSINNELYWQVSTKKDSKDKEKPADKPGKDLMKERKAAPPSNVYVKASDYSILKDGEKEYAYYLASKFGSHTREEAKEIDLVTKFEGEYGFANKLLPVWKVQYEQNNQERFYVETSSGLLATRIDNVNMIEGYSFAFLHKHHFMDFAGKEARDVSTMFWAASQLAMIIVGLILWRKSRKKQQA